MKIALTIVVGGLFFASAVQGLTLEESVDIALQQNPQMLKTKAEISAAEGIAGQAAAGFLPKLSLFGSRGKYYAKPITVQMTIAGTPTVFNYGTDEQADLSSYGLSLSQPLFTGGKLSSSVSLAQKGILVAKEELKKIAQEVTFNVVEAYYNVLKAREFAALNEEAVKMAKDHLDQVKYLLRVGSALEMEVLRSQVQLSNAQLSLTKAKQAEDLAKNQFNFLLGKDLDEVVELEEIEFEPREISFDNYSRLLDLAYENRPDWKQYLLGKKISEDEVRIAYSSLFPSLSLVGNLDSQSIKYSSYQSDSYSWKTLFYGSWDLFDGTYTWNKVKEARARLASRRVEESRIKQAIALEVKNAHFSWKSAEENLNTAQQALQAAEENYKLSHRRYQSARGTNLEVLDAQTALTSAKMSYYQALFDLEIAKARINKVVGKEVL